MAGAFSIKTRHADFVAFSPQFLCFVLMIESGIMHFAIIIIENKLNIPRIHSELSDVEAISCLINAFISLDKAHAASFNKVLSVNDIFQFIAILCKIKVCQ